MLVKLEFSRKLQLKVLVRGGCFLGYSLLFSIKNQYIQMLGYKAILSQDPPALPYTPNNNNNNNQHKINLLVFTTMNNNSVQHGVMCNIIATSLIRCISRSLTLFLTIC